MDATAAGNAMELADAALAQVSPAEMPQVPPGPIAVGSAAEKARLRALIEGRSDIPPDPALAHLPPEQQRGQAQQQRRAPTPVMEFAPEAAEPPPAAEPEAAPAAEPADADLAFQEELLSRGTKPAAAAPASDDIAAERARLTAAQEKAMRAHESVVDAAREIKRDPVGAMAQLGISPEMLQQQLRARGHIAAEPASTPSDFNLPEDATPAEKALFQRNKALEAQLGQVSGQMNSVLSHLSERDRAESESARRAQRQLVTSDAASHLRSVALRMPALRSTQGKLTSEGELLIREASRRFNDTLPAGGLDSEAARKRAEGFLAEAARDVGITPKAARAERALSPGRRPPVPNLQGATAPRTVPGQKPGGGYAFDFDDTEKRQAAMADWFNQQAQQPSA